MVLKESVNQNWLNWDGVNLNLITAFKQDEIK